MRYQDMPAKLSAGLRIVFQQQSAVFMLLLLIAAPSVGFAQSADDRYPFVRNGKVGFIDSQGREVIPPRFSNAGDTAHFNNGLAPVFEAGRGSGYINPAGDFLIGPTMEWGWGRPFHEGIAAVMIVGINGGLNRPAWIDTSGRIVFSGMGTEGAYFSSGLMPMPRDGKWGFVNKSFEFVIQPQFDYAYEFWEGLAEVTVNGKSGFINPSGTFIVAAKYDMVWPFQDGLARVRYDVPNGTVRTIEGDQPNFRYRYGFVDKQGNEVVPLKFSEATYFSDGYALAVPPKSKRFAIIDKSGKIVHAPEFEDAEPFHEGLAATALKGKYGYIDTAGTWVIEPTLSYAGEFRNGLARVAWKDGDYGYIDKTGKVVWRISNDPPKDTN
jgi:WG containing repeat